MVNKIKKIIIESIFEEIILHYLKHSEFGVNLFLGRQSDNYENWHDVLQYIDKEDVDHLIFRHYYRSKTKTFKAESELIDDGINLYHLSICKLINIKKNLKLYL